MQAPRLDARRGPLGFGDPAPGPLPVEGPGRQALLEVGAVERLVHDARRRALQPVVPPAQALLQEADRRRRHGEVRVLVDPGAGQAEPGRPEAGEQPRDGVGVGVAPAADGEDRGLDRREVHADRAVLPETVAPLMPQPVGHQQRLVLQALQPDLPPRGADQDRVRRTGRVGEHGRGPAQVLVQQAAALVVDVVGVAVVGRAERDDGLQGRRPARGDLEPVEPAPGDADHADGAAAPGLGRDPGDHLEGVVLFLFQILVPHEAVGLAVAAHVDPDAGVAVAGEVGVGQLVTVGRTVALAIGDVLQDAGHRLALGVHRQPDPRRQSAAVRHGNPGVLDLPDPPRKLPDLLQSLAPGSRRSAIVRARGRSMSRGKGGAGARGSKPAPVRPPPVQVSTRPGPVLSKTVRRRLSRRRRDSARDRLQFSATVR